jgi:hypothetical protein
VRRTCIEPAQHRVIPSAGVLLGLLLNIWLLNLRPAECQGVACAPVVLLIDIQQPVEECIEVDACDRQAGASCKQRKLTLQEPCSAETAQWAWLTQVE